MKSAIARTINNAKSTVPITNIKGTKKATQNHKMMPPQILKNLALK
jgi:hypothetical protein